MRKDSLKGIVRVPISQCSPIPESCQCMINCEVSGIEDAMIN